MDYIIWKHVCDNKIYDWSDSNLKKDVKERAEKFRDRVHHHMRNEGLDPENPKHRSEHYKRLRIDEKILEEILSGISRAFGNYITDDESEMFLVKCEESLEEHEKKSK